MIDAPITQPLKNVVIKRTIVSLMNSLLSLYSRSSSISIFISFVRLDMLQLKSRLYMRLHLYLLSSNRNYCGTHSKAHSYPDYFLSVLIHERTAPSHACLALSSYLATRLMSSHKTSFSVK